MRLIDTDMMNEELFYKELGGKDSLITAECVFDMLKAQPTAYNVDRVVEQLDAYITKIVGRNSALYQTIIGIVRKGGTEE
jgi:hypothetical protein